MNDLLDREISRDEQAATCDAMRTLLLGMNNPVAFTLRLKPYKRSHSGLNGKRLSTRLDSHDIESVVKTVGDHLRKATFPHKERRVIQKVPILFGCLEYGMSDKQPHLHLVADNVHGIGEHQFSWMLKQCCGNASRFTKWISGSPHISGPCDCGWVSYMLKHRMLYFVLTK